MDTPRNITHANPTHTPHHPWGGRILMFTQVPWFWFTIVVYFNGSQHCHWPVVIHRTKIRMHCMPKGGSTAVPTTGLTSIPWPEFAMPWPAGICGWCCTGSGHGRGLGTVCSQGRSYWIHRGNDVTGRRHHTWWLWLCESSPTRFFSDLGMRTTVQITSAILDGTRFLVMLVVAPLSLWTISLEEPIYQ